MAIPTLIVQVCLNARTTTTAKHHFVVQSTPLGVLCSKAILHCRRMHTTSASTACSCRSKFNVQECFWAGRSSLLAILSIGESNSKVSSCRMSTVYQLWVWIHSTRLSMYTVTVSYYAMGWSSSIIKYCVLGSLAACMANSPIRPD